jgi:hypothetical protein
MINYIMAIKEVRKVLANDGFKLESESIDTKTNFRIITKYSRPVPSSSSSSSTISNNINNLEEPKESSNK